MIEEPSNHAPAADRQRQLPWMITGVTVAFAILCLSVLAAGKMHRAAEREAFARADLAADAASLQTLRVLGAIEYMTDQAELALRMRQSGQDMAAATMESALQRSIAREGIGVTQMCIVDETNWVRWASYAHFEPRFVGPLPFAPDVRNGLQVQSDVADDDFLPAKRGTLRFARSITDEAGNFRGFVIVAVEPLILSARLARRAAGNSAAVRLVQLPQGQVVADSAATSGFLDHRPKIEGGELARMLAANAGHALDPDGAKGRDSVLAFRHLVPRADRRQAAPQVADALAVEVVLDAAELHSARRQGALIYEAAAGFALLCVASLAVRAVLLRRRHTRAALAEAWRQVRAVKAVRGELEQLLVNLPVAAYQCRVMPDGEYDRRYVSPMLAHMTGWPMEALADATQWERKLEDGPDGRLTGFFASVLHDGEGMTEYRMRKPDGGWVWLRERARVGARLPNGGGEVIGTIADMSAEGELALQAAMASKLSMLGEMASGLAHELNQPVTVIGLAADRVQSALEATPTNMDAARRALGTITAQAQRSTELIDQLRLFGRADMAPLGPVALGEAVSGAMILAEGPLRDAGVTLRLDLAETPPVLGRLVQIEQVIVNLCMNARDALLVQPRGSRVLTIAAETDGEHVRLRVSDTGGGIPPEVMSRLFDPFVTTKPAGAGSGLGLSICQRLMRGIDGEIAARNAAGGAVFTLTFRHAPLAVMAVAGG